MGQVRIIGGFHRSRVLKFKDNINGLRPTPDRVRETVFNWLGQRLAGKSCLDLFAGSGAMGFEAMSRGALSIVMVERNKNVYSDLVSNRNLLKAENIEIYNQDALNYIKQAQSTFDIIFIDPPYASNLLEQTLNALKSSKILTQNTLIYIECQNQPDLTGYEIFKSGKAGMVHYALLKNGG